jgi:lipase
LAVVPNPLTILDVGVPGGSLAVARRGPGPDAAHATVVLVHGITASHRAWDLVLSRLPDEWCVAAVDLRGRGASADLPGPYGLRRHADDVAAVLDHLGASAAVLVGHSLGAFVTTMFGLRHPERLGAAVLVDGGVALPFPAERDPDAVLAEVLGPALERLGRTFASREEYRAFWRAHPALIAVPGPVLDAYVDHDLGGVAPRLRSRVSPEAVRVDGAEVLVDSEVAGALDHLRCPVELLRVERGLLDQPEPLIPQEAATAAAARNPRLRVVTVPGLNHYTITLTPDGADAVAAAARRAVAASR